MGVCGGAKQVCVWGGVPSNEVRRLAKRNKETKEEDELNKKIEKDWREKLRVADDATV